MAHDRADMWFVVNNEDGLHDCRAREQPSRQ
jgi:hypothetical protein